MNQLDRIVVTSLIIAITVIVIMLFLTSCQMPLR